MNDLKITVDYRETASGWGTSKGKKSIPLCTKSQEQSVDYFDNITTI